VIVEKSKIAKIFCVHIAFVIAITLLTMYFHIEEAEVENGEELVKNYFSSFVFAVIFAPFLEEVIFRYPLVKSKYVYAPLVVGLLVGGTLENGILALSFVAVTMCSFVVYFFLKKEKLPIYITVLYVILFTIFHITNYKTEDLQTLTWYVLILQFYPQLLIAIVLTIVRLKTRFLYALAYHAAYNFIFFLIAVVSYQLK
jgi:hypothetical protein